MVVRCVTAAAAFLVVGVSENPLTLINVNSNLKLTTATRETTKHT